MSSSSLKNQKRNLRSNSNQTNTKLTKKSERNDAHLLTTPSFKRKSSSSPTSPDNIQAAKKSTSDMSSNQISMEQFAKLLADHTSKIASDMQSQLVAHAEAVKTEIKMQLVDHTTTMQNEIKIQLDSHTASVQNEIKSLGEQLKSDLTGQINDVNKKIDTLQANVNGQLVTLQTIVDNCINRINISEDDVRRTAKLNELKIKGIPYATDENLSTLFKSISELVGYDLTGPNCIPELNRMQTKNKAVNELIPLPTIIVKFVAKHIRDNFYSLYLSKVSKKPLKTEDINLAQGGHPKI